MWASVFLLLLLGGSALAGARFAVWRLPDAQGWSGALLVLFFLGAFSQSPLVQSRIGLFASRVRRLPSRAFAIAGTAVFIVGVVGSWQLDFHNRNFFDTGWLLVLFNFWRLCLFIFLIMILRGTGWGLRRALEQRYLTPIGQDSLERFSLDCTIGAAIWIPLMFVAGIFGFFYRPAALIIAVPVCAAGLHVTVADMIAAHVGKEPPHQASATITPATAGGLAMHVIVIAFVLTVLLGLGGVADEYDNSHYLPYYLQAVSYHGTDFNDYWYHFWITKGAGLQFLAILLGDIFSASLASFALFVVTGCFVVAFIRRISSEWAFPILALLMFLCPFLVIRHFQYKQHYVVMGLLVASAWSAAWLCRPRTQTLRPGLILLGLFSGAAVICNAPLAAFIGVWLTMFAVAVMISQGRQERSTLFLWSIAPAIVAVCVAVFIVVLNYLWVGMAEASPFKVFFDYANQRQMSRYISPYLWLFIEEASSETTGRVILASLWPIDFGGIWHLLHFGAFPFDMFEMLGVFGIGGLTLFFSRVRKQLGWPAFCLALMLFSAGLVSLLVSQPGSLHRLYTFTLPLVLFLLLLSVVAVIQLVVGRRKQYSDIAAAVIATIFGIYISVFAGNDYVQKSGPNKLMDQLRFVWGSQSLADTVGMLPTCAKMADTFTAASASAGLSSADKPKVWTLNFLLPVGCYILPQPQIMMEVSASFGPRWHRVVFGSEQETLYELDRLGIRHFYVDLAAFDVSVPTTSSSSIFGCMAYSQLFHPGAIQQNFRVVWRERDSFLLALTSAAPNGAPVPEEFLERWPGKRDQFQHGLGQMKELCARVAGYYREQGENWPVRADRTLPRLKGWQ